MNFFDQFKELFGKYRKEIFFFVLFFLVSTLSFGLGYLTAREFTRTPIVIEMGDSD